MNMICFRYIIVSILHNGDNKYNNNNNIIKNKKEQTSIPTVVAIPADRNAVQKEVGKKLKYKSLRIEIQ